MEAMRESWTDARLDDFAAHTDRRFDSLERRVENGFDRVESRLDALQRTIILANAGMFAAVIGLVATQL